MKTAQSILLAALVAVTIPAKVPASAARVNDADAGGAQASGAQQYGALERGYRTGYSDGYQSGYRDSAEGRGRDARSKEEYQRADRVYLPAYGSLEQYRDGYQQGFESGYDTGYERRGFDSTIPPTLRPRGATAAPATPRAGQDRPVIRQSDDRNNSDDERVAAINANPPVADPNPNSSGAATLRGTVAIPSDLRLRVELLNNLTTDVSQRGDRFEARVVEPAQFADAIVSGRLTSVRRPGKVRGSGQLQLTFEQIRLPDGRSSSFSAQVVEVVEKRTDTGVGDVDAEGGVRGQGTTKDDVTKVGAATGIGAIIGAIAGGGKGAAIGAAIGAGVGTGGVLTARGRDVRLERGQELLIRTNNETRIQ
jgi:hypothetical protein